MTREKMLQIAKKLEAQNTELTAKAFERTKYGRLLYGLEICKGNVHPCIYFNDFPEDEEEDRIIDFIRVCLDGSNDFETDVFNNRSYWLSHLQMNIISSSFKNELITNDVYVEDFLDTVLYFSCIVRSDNNGIASIKVTNKIMEMFEFTPLVLHRYAEFNMSTMMYIRPISQVLAEMMGCDPFEGSGVDDRLYVLTNTSKCDGAAMIALDVALENLESILGNDIFIIPSSKHEVLAISSADFNDCEALIQTISEVNNTQVKPEDLLSYNLYRYKNGSLTIV